MDLRRTVTPTVTVHQRTRGPRPGTVDDMRRVSTAMVSIGLLALLSVGCAATGARVDDLRNATDERGSRGTDAADGTGFCLSLARAAAAIESDSPETAEEATEEALARAPVGIVDDARELAESVREDIDRDDWDPDDPELTAAVEHLTQSARTTCDPG